MDQLFPLLMAPWKILLCENTSPFTKAAYLDIWTTVGEYVLTRLSFDGKPERKLSRKNNVLILPTVQSSRSFESSTMAFAEFSRRLTIKIHDSANIFSVTPLLTRSSKLCILISHVLSLIQEERKDNGIVLKDNLSQHNLLLELANVEPEISCFLMGKLEKLLIGTVVRGPFAKAMCALACTTRDMDVRTTATNLLAGLLDTLVENEGWSECMDMNRQLSNLKSRRQQDLIQAPSIVESDMKVWGYAIDARRRIAGSWTNELVIELKVWTQTLRIALTESSVNLSSHRTSPAC